MATRHDADPKALLAARRRETAKPERNKARGLTPRVRQAIELIVFGDDLGTTTRLKEAAERVGLGVSSLRAAMLKPAVDAFYRQQLTLYRNGERAQSLRTLAEIRDDPKLKGNAAGATARIKAAEKLAFDQPGQAVNVNVGVDVNVTTPGYVIDLTEPERPKIIEHRTDDAFLPVEEVLEFPPQPMRETSKEF